MPSLLQRRPRAPSPTAPSGLLARGAFVIVAVVLLAGWSVLVGDRDRVDLHLSNPTRCTADAELVLDDGRTLLDLGQVTAGADVHEQGLLDQGETWRVRWSYAGRTLAEETRTRAQLAVDGWRITAPPSVADRASGTGCDEASRNGTSGGVPTTARTS